MKSNQQNNLDKRPYPVAQNNPKMAYSRYYQEVFNKNRNEADGFKIDMRSNSFGKNRLPFETPTGTSIADGMSKVGSVNQTPVDTFNRGANQNMANSGGRQKKSESRKKKTPIIIIPAASTSVITQFNAKSLLEKHFFVDSKSARTKADQSERAGDLLIQRKKVMSNGEEQQVHYRVINNVNKLEPRDWERVVCVFVQGPQWQFKGWPWLGGDSEGDITDIFQRTCAFHVRMSHLPLDANIKKWSVQLLELEQNARHQDGAKIRKMWASLESWIAKNKPDLRY